MSTRYLPHSPSLKVSLRFCRWRAQQRRLGRTIRRVRGPKGVSVIAEHPKPKTSTPQVA